jgi:hypothetical protein
MSCCSSAIVTFFKVLVFFGVLKEDLFKLLLPDFWECGLVIGISSPKDSTS